MSEHIIAAIVEHKPGVLFKITNLIRRRGFNISSISVGSTENPDLARITMVVTGDETTIEQVAKQLQKIVEVIRISRLNPSESVIRELLLVKVHVADSRARSDIVSYTQIFRGRIVDVSSDSMVIEVTGGSNKINAFIELMRQYGIKELARTGITALARGERGSRALD
ncbi:MAG: acetolactate synthase small subunit [Nitrososphaerota archaeon]|nr:acetolactate synthase small subunit [Candidatus Bathyarchaeota archaeon]MCX8162779.1 acetolactate synthase small subunit [Candidatus Bathyarchaeota archaeon]MDW8061108.1 acetolactate synthase small subunit [Nitrososphaerota archaeon]